MASLNFKEESARWRLFRNINDPLSPKIIQVHSDNKHNLEPLFLFKCLSNTCILTKLFIATLQARDGSSNWPFSDSKQSFKQPSGRSKTQKREREPVFDSQKLLA